MGKDHDLATTLNREIIVLDHKRSNAINIGLTKLPPPRIIRAAVMKMDSSIVNREGVEKLLTMLPTEEEVSQKIWLILILFLYSTMDCAILIMLAWLMRSGVILVS